MSSPPSERWPPPERWRLPLLLVLLVLGWFGGLGQIDLRGEEPRRALVAWEMLTSGNYWRPTIQGEPYYNKPPLFNWFIAFCYRIFGTESWVVRLPSLVAYLTWAWLNYRLVSRWVNRSTGLWSTLFFLTAVHYLFFATVVAGELDLLFGLFVYGQGVCLYWGYRNQRWWPTFLGSYALMALGFLTKGVPAIAYQGLGIIALLLFDWRSSKHQVETKYTTRGWLFGLPHWAGATLGFGLIYCYFASHENRYGDGWLYLANLLEEATQKSVTEGKPLAILRQLVTLPGQFLVDHLPWVLLLPYGLWRGWHRRALDHPFLRYCLLFFGVNVLLYWLSPGARIRYFYGLVPFLFVPLAYWLTRFRPVRSQWLWSVLFVLALGRIVYNYTLLPYQQRTTGTIQLYRQITNETLALTAGQPLYTCCEPDTLFVDPSVAGYTLLRDTIVFPMYTPYQIPLYLQRRRGAVVPFRRRPDRPGFYLSTDTLVGPPLRTYGVWDNKELHLFRVE